MSNLSSLPLSFSSMFFNMMCRRGPTHSWSDRLEMNQQKPSVMVWSDGNAGGGLKGVNGKLYLLSGVYRRQIVSTALCFTLLFQVSSAGGHGSP